MQGLSLYRKLVFSIVVLIYILPQHAHAQPAEIPFHVEPYYLDTGRHDGRIGLTAETNSVFREIIHVPGVPWLWLQF